MAYSIKFTHPNYGKDVEFDLGPGIGLVKNGGSVKLSEEQEQEFVSRTGQSVKEHFKGNAMAEVTGTTELKGGGES